MDATSPTFYTVLMLEVLCFVVLCCACERQRKRRSYAVDDEDNMRMHHDSVTQPQSFSTLNAQTSTAATVLFSAATARQQRRQSTFAPYFPVAEFTERMAEGNVVGRSSRSSSSDKDAPYGKADYFRVVPDQSESVSLHVNALH